MPMKTSVLSLLFLLLTLSTSLEFCAGNPVITEFLAINDSDLKDSDGDSSPWIEVLNAGTSSISTENYFLTDDPAQLNKWKLPKSTLTPGSYVVIFASGKNQTSGSEWHTNFELKKKDGFLALVAADGKTVIDQFGGEAYPAQEADMSFGKSVTKDVVRQAIVSSGAVCTVLVPKKTLGLRWCSSGLRIQAGSKRQRALGSSKGVDTKDSSAATGTSAEPCMESAAPLTSGFRFV